MKKTFSNLAGFWFLALAGMCAPLSAGPDSTKTGHHDSLGKPESVLVAPSPLQADTAETQSSKGKDSVARPDKTEKASPSAIRPDSAVTGKNLSKDTVFRKEVSLKKQIPAKLRDTSHRVDSAVSKVKSKRTPPDSMVTGKQLPRDSVLRKERSSIIPEKRRGTSRDLDSAATRASEAKTSPATIENPKPLFEKTSLQKSGSGKKATARRNVESKSEQGGKAGQAGKPDSIEAGKRAVKPRDSSFAKGKDSSVHSAVQLKHEDRESSDTARWRGVLPFSMPGTGAGKAADSSGKRIQLLESTPIKVITASKVLSSLAVLLVGWLILRYLAALFNLLSERWSKHRLTIKGLVPVVRILGWTAVIYVIVVVIYHPPIESVLALTASAGIAIGIASQDILKNIFGGVMILLDKPFKVGDKIKIDEHYGEVLSIGLRTVRIVTGDDSVISVPNSEIVSKSVSNSNSGAADCQVVAEFFFDQGLDLDMAHELAVKCAALSRYIYLKKPVAVVFKNEINEGKSIIRMRLKAYVFDHRFEFAFATDMSKIVLREFAKAGLVCPLDTKTTA